MMKQFFGSFSYPFILTRMGKAATKPTASINRRDAMDAEVRIIGFFSAFIAPLRLNRSLENLLRTRRSWEIALR